MKTAPLFVALLATTPLVANGWEQNPHQVPNKWDISKNSFYAEVDYLIWYANQEGMSFASRINSPENLSHNANSQDQFFKNRWNSGVKGLIGFKPASRSWDTQLVYTYFATKNSPKQLSGTLINYSGTAISPAYVEVIIGTTTRRPTVDYAVDPLWKLTFSAMDLEFGKEFQFSPQTALRPFFGLRGVWTNQTFEETINLIINTTDTANSILTERNKFSGFGARAGFDMNYTLGYGLTLYGNFAAGILWGWFNVGQFNNSDNSSERFNHSHHSSVFNFDVGIGFKWNYPLNYNRHLFTVKLGWEQHLFRNINQFQNFSNSSNVNTSSSYSLITTEEVIIDRNVARGDLTLSGFIAGVGYAF